MKTKTLKFTALFLCTVLLFCILSCSKQESADVWENAVYTADTEFGEGSKIAVVEVKVNNHLVKFTVKTDKQTVGDALLEHGLITGDAGQFGLYVKVVNGITADYDVDSSYWAFYIDGEMAMTGVDATDISEGSVYRLEYTK